MISPLSMIPKVSAAETETYSHPRGSRGLTKGRVSPITPHPFQRPTRRKLSLKY